MTDTALPPVTIFLVWVAFLTLAITGLVLFRWRHPDRYSRFQLKLTLILLLFLLVPTVPLLYVAGTVVDQARALVVALPVGDALERGLRVVRLALAADEERLKAWQAGLHASPQQMAPVIQDIPPPDFVLHFRKSPQRDWEIASVSFPPGAAPSQRDSLRAVPPDPRRTHPHIIQYVLFSEQERVLYHYGSRGVYLLMVQGSTPEEVRGAGVWISPELVDALPALDRGLWGLGQIALLGGRGFQEVLWMLASLWLVALALAAFAASRTLARGVSEPVLKLAEGMTRVADGRLDVEVSVRARDEMQVLVHSFNTMTGQLREARERIVLAEKQAAWRDVARRIAHEIKNPLTPLQLGLHRLQRRLEKEPIWGADPALQETCRTMNEEVDALRRMAASFSEYAQLPQPRMDPGDLESIARGAAALFQEGAHRVSCQVVVTGRIPPISMDSELVKRALINLIKNAMESVEEAGGGQVLVRLNGGAESIDLSVEDTGVGFDPERGPRLLHPDYTTKKRGTGLGLSVVARIIADHGWTMEASSQGSGRGAQFRLRIPLSHVPGNPVSGELNR